MKDGFTPRREPRMDRRIVEHDHDSYAMCSKPSEPTVCPQCGAVYRKGRWTWSDHPPADARETKCSACHRVADRNPAGILRLAGDFVAAHEGEILGLVRNQEALEKGEHPMARIMDLGTEGNATVVTTTDIHLPRRIGDALHRAYEGKLDIHYDKAGYFVRMEWTRND